MGWYLKTLLALALALMIPLYILLDSRFKYALYLPINATSIFLYLWVRRYVKSTDLDVVIKTLSRLVKFGACYLLLYTTASLVDVEYICISLTWSAILLTIDLVRAYLYELSKKNFENKVLTGYFADILKLEKYIVYSTEGPGSIDLDRHLTVDEYFSRGRPKHIVVDDLFSLWNDQNPYTECSSESELTVQENDGARRKTRRRWRVSILPETYELESARGRQPWNLQQIAKVGLTQSEERREKTFVVDPNETLSDTEVEYNGSTGDEDLSGDKWKFLEPGKNSVKKTPSRPGLVTMESLKLHFGEKNGEEVYNLISFKRSEGINYDVFRENGRQINNERNNLYRTIEDNKNLLEIIRLILILIESVSSYFIVATYLNVQLLLLELMIPVLVVPALPIVKVTLESFLFIVYTHPYDPGDRVHIDNENMVVRSISLFYTTLERWDGLIVTISNLVIKDKAIFNIRRSKSQQWRLEMLISSGTPEKKIELLKEAIRKFVKNHRVYITSSVNVVEIIDSAYIRLQIIVKHAMNFQSGFFMWNNHTRFANMIVMAMHALNIKFRPIDMEVMDLSNSIKTN